MGIVRNFIDIIGITPENELPGGKNGHMVVFSEAENIFLPEGKEEIETIYQIMIDLQIKSERKISTPLGKIQVLDGLKRFKIIYAGRENGGQINILSLSMPFNTFLDLPDNIENGGIRVFILDAYFELIDGKRIYGHFLYMLELHSDAIAIPRKRDVKSSFQDFSSYRAKEADKKERFEGQSYIIDEVSISNEDRTNEVIEKAENEGLCSSTENKDFIDIDSEYL